MNKWLLSILLVVCFNAYPNSQNIYEYQALSVSVFLNDSETIEQAVHRAESMLQINAVTMTPKFVTHNTHYDSRTDEIVEKGLIAQGANVRVFNTHYEHGLEEGKIVLHVTADVSVDISAMQAKLGSDKRERLLESTIDDLTSDYQKLSGVLEKMKQNITLSNLDSIVIAEYYAALNSAVGVIDGDAIKAQLRAHKEGTTSEDKLNAEIVAAYEMFVFPFMANPTINYQVVDIIPHDYSVAEVKVRVTLDRKGGINDEWYPSVKNQSALALCQKFFFGCDSFGLYKTKRVDVKELLRPKYCGESIFEFLPYYRPGASSFVDDDEQIRCGSSKKYAYRNMVFYQTGYTKKQPSTVMPNDPELFTTALKLLSNNAFWMTINIGGEKFKLNISNLLIDEITVSAYMPEADAIKGIKVGFSVGREVFDPSSYQWKDMNGKFLRYQSREIEFY
ncbi:hypothetical protein [Shewanella algicola]|uniref:hypothetical protein n=1 Tax=Shewanella algicola TaxID=640633 RepID=UPI00249591C2|nr:hypothetical protein [Shewanella algicola]